MKSEEIIALFRQFESIANEYEGVECWSARELSNLLGYAQWRNFENIIEKKYTEDLTERGNLCARQLIRWTE